MRSAIDNHGSFNLIHYETAFKVDIYIPKIRAFDEMQLERRELSTIVYVAGPEGTILAKLEWYRPGGETPDRQWRDILGVLKTRAEAIGLEYLRHWATWKPEICWNGSCEKLPDGERGRIATTAQCGDAQPSRVTSPLMPSLRLPANRTVAISDTSRR